MQAFATHINEMLKIGIAARPRFLYSDRGYAVESDFPADRQHNKLVANAVERANLILTEFLDLGEFIIRPTSPRKKTSARVRAVDSGHGPGHVINYPPPSATAREAKARSLARVDAEEAELLEIEVERFEAGARLAAAEDRNSELIKVSKVAHHAGLHLLTPVHKQPQANRGNGGMTRPFRGPGSRGGRIPKSVRDSLSIERDSSSSVTPADLESMGGSTTRAPAVKSSSIPPETNVSASAKKKTPAKALTTPAAKGESTKAKNTNATPKKRPSKKQVSSGETVTKGQSAKRRKGVKHQQ